MLTGLPFSVSRLTACGFLRRVAPCEPQARSFIESLMLTPLLRADFTSYWVYVAGPLAGAMLAVGAAWVLRGPGGAAPDQAPPRVTSIPRSSTPTRPEAVSGP
jgi:hypothetical protein